MQLLTHTQHNTATASAARPTSIEDTMEQAPLPWVQTEQERRTAALDGITNDPDLRRFYERVVPAHIEPAAWMPFWPSAWSGLRADALDQDLT